MNRSAQDRASGSGAERASVPARELDRRASPVEFLDRRSYRQRRFRDVARVLPLFAAILMMLPLMWPRTGPAQSLTSTGMIYLFGLWVVLIGVSFVLSRLLTFDQTKAARAKGDKAADPVIDAVQDWSEGRP